MRISAPERLRRHPAALQRGPASPRRRLNSPCIQRHTAAASPEACAPLEVAGRHRPSVPSPPHRRRRARRPRRGAPVVRPAVPAARPAGVRAARRKRKGRQIGFGKVPVVLRVLLRPHATVHSRVSSHKRVSVPIRPPASSTCACRAISNSRARCRLLNEFRFFDLRARTEPGLAAAAQRHVRVAPEPAFLHVRGRCANRDEHRPKPAPRTRRQRRPTSCPAP